VTRRLMQVALALALGLVAWHPVFPSAVAFVGVLAALVTESWLETSRLRLDVRGEFEEVKAEVHKLRNDLSGLKIARAMQR
jgi:hypothetical protein